VDFLREGLELAVSRGTALMLGWVLLGLAGWKRR